MDIFNSLHQKWDQYLYDQGRMSDAEHLIRNLPEADRPIAKHFMLEMSRTEVAADPTRFYHTVQQFGQFLQAKKEFLPSQTRQEVEKSFIIRGSADLFGYRPAGTRIWNYFANPFGVFSYVAQQYPAVRACVELVRGAIEEDGFYLVAADGVSKKKLQNVYDILMELNIEYLLIEMMAHLEIYGNTWIYPKMTGPGKTLKEIKLMFPNRLLPVFERTTEQIISWEYLQGRVRSEYSKDELLQLMFPSADNDQIGAPPLVGAVTLIETAIHAMQLNNTIFQKGGLIGHIVSLASPDDSTGVGGSHDSDWVRRVQQQFDYLYSGSKAGQGVVAMANIDNVYPLTNIGELDANWQFGSNRTDKIVAMLMGVPSEKIGIPRSEHAQYTPEMVEVVVNAQFDSTINRLCRKVYKFVNKEILKKRLGIDDVKLVPAGRYGATTLSAAQTILTLAQVGNIITVNEAREKILGWEPLPIEDKRGSIVLNVSAPRATKEGDKLIADVIAPEKQDLELASDSKAIDKLWNESGLALKVGGAYDGQIFKENKKNPARRS